MSRTHLDLKRPTVVVQFPLADLRWFNRTPAKLSKPMWPEPLPEEFLRNVGRVNLRVRGMPGLGLEETTFCNAERVVKFAKDPSTESSGSIIPTYRRLIGSPWGYRLDLGFRCFPQGQSTAWHISSQVLHLPIFVAGYRRAIPLYSCHRGLLPFLSASTSSTRHDTRSPTSGDTLGLRPARPLVIVEHGAESNVPTITSRTVYTEDSEVAVYALQRAGRRGTQSRLVRAAVWRLHYDVQLLAAVSSAYRLNPSVFDEEKLSAYLNSCLPRLAKKKRGGILQGSMLALAEETVGFDRTDLASLSVEVRKWSKGLARQIDLILERSQLVRQAIEVNARSGAVAPILIGNYTVSKNEFKNIKDSQIISGSPKSNIVDSTNIQKDATLQDAVDEIVEYLRMQGSGEASELASALKSEVHGENRRAVSSTLWSRIKNLVDMSETISKAIEVVDKFLG